MSFSALFLVTITVSNPLRLEGDQRLQRLLLQNSPRFLIHYGWRGTT